MSTASGRPAPGSLEWSGNARHTWQPSPAKALPLTSPCLQPVDVNLQPISRCHASSLATTFFMKVRWVTPLGVETASMA
jgi:hypothetical protein